MAEQEKQPSQAEQLAQTGAQQIGKQAVKKAVSSGAGKAIAKSAAATAIKAGAGIATGAATAGASIVAEQLLSKKGRERIAKLSGAIGMIVMSPFLLAGAMLAGIPATIGATIGITALVTIIGIPTIVMLTIFIINSGAYLVPPSVGVGGSGGDVTAGELCLPASGIIQQLAYCESTNYTHCRSNLNAYDVKNSILTPIYAVHSGTAISIADDPSEENRDQGYGNYVIITGSGIITYYGHMINLDIIPPSASKIVQKGDLIGYMGNTGNSTNPHLHFEMKAPSAHIKTVFGEVTINQQVINCFGK